MPRGSNPNSRKALEQNRIKGQFTHETAVLNGEKGRSAQAELRSISEELKNLLNEKDTDGVFMRHRMAEIVMQRAAESPKWFELMLKLAGEMPADNINLINTKPNEEAINRMVEKLHEFQKNRQQGGNIGGSSENVK